MGNGCGTTPTRCTTPGTAPSSTSGSGAQRMAAPTRPTPSGGGSRRAAISRDLMPKICWRSYETKE
uniref:Uncharacterized protein n=1 Tax=Arundo donax TaxID=35708 RepID=A0A0A9DLN3_ARUDO